MKYNVEILDEALDELEGIVDYIAVDSIVNALHWYEKVTTAIHTLDNMPKRCPLADENPAFPFEVRCLLVNNYRVLYRINGGVVEVLHVKHPRKDHVQE
jgi:toxin ParE1/3/4